MRRVVAWFVAALAMLAAVSYLATTVATDRFAWMQPAWWAPRLPFALGCTLLACVAALLSRSRSRGRRAWSAVAALLVVFAVLDLDRDFGLPRERPAEGVRVVHWNTAWTSESDSVDALAALLALDAHVVVLSDAGHLFGEGGLSRAEAAGYSYRSRGRLSLLSRFPVAESRSLYAASGASVARFAVETNDGPLVIDGIDLPRDLRIGRYEQARQLALDLAGKGPAPDVLVGDFNSTRGSASVGLLLAGGIDAFEAAGSGWGGTYPRTRPLLAIDLMLVKPPWRAAWARMHDLGTRPHRAQEVVLIRSK
ncbi:MAG: hypothetical protein LW636_07485 [Planctomycetaceae bacterium]|jgi:endonuclease/exonuclease/phosphatase family metal-dependent hydrolase|nr:hypothetical protein [Planctomycetaceae bacterium]